MPVGCNKSHMYIVTPRAILKKTRQTDTLKNAIIKPRQNLKKYLMNTQQALKEEQW